MYRQLNIMLCVLLLISPARASNQTPETWTPHPVILQVRGTDLWCMSDIQTSTSGRYFHSCIFGFKKKRDKEFSLVEILRLPRIENLAYHWKVIDNKLVISNAKSKEIILELNLELFSKLSTLDMELETESSESQEEPFPFPSTSVRGFQECADE
ncbi:hypothetical protein [uncultured Akkermansia sp.]|uniref:hypothetical protein n=1 Tax=uncultured Akkermansia sp. TaxID=512294 RepID=UPI00265CFDF4|nr:hypothetical protein [uncultured Akkermansia sp.]